MNEKKKAERNLNATVAKMHAVYGKRLRQEDYAALMSCTSVADAAGYLKRNTYYGRALENISTETIHRGNLENILRRSFMENYFRMINFEKIGSDEFYNYIIIKTEIDEILICILHLNAGTGDHITTLPIYMNKFTSFNLMELAKVESFTELLALIEKTPYHSLLKPFKPEKEDGHIDYAGCELKLRTYYNKRLIGSVENFDPQVQKHLKMFIGTQIDMINIINSYRMKRFFNADTEDIKKRMIPIYIRMPEKKMDELYAARDDKQFLEILAKSFYGREIQSLDYDFSNGPELSLIYMRYIQAKRAFGRSQSAPECFYTFNQLLEIEVKNIIRIIEGIRYSLTPSEISKFIITS